MVERAVSRARCIDVIAKAKQSWRRFRASEPGYRFQDRYRRQQESEHGWTDPRRLFYLVGGLILAGGSLLLGALPGPGMLTFFVGLAMIDRRGGSARRPAAGLGRWGGKGIRHTRPAAMEGVRSRGGL